MTIFDERERAFENPFAHEEELRGAAQHVVSCLYDGLR